MAQFRKSFGGDFDRVDVTSSHDSDWVNIEMRVGYNVSATKIQLRSTDAVRDLHYALGCYLAKVDKER